ncbi:MAG: universal stress protein [Polyangiaceae bacterium]|jgi:nucleotide-binding universal stress UspA family protein|nr:universal stress protein [Polyangiaceae bacterium]
MAHAPVIVVPTDFSPASTVALERAKELARKLGETIALVHVIDEGFYYVAPLGVPAVPATYLSELEQRLIEHLGGIAASVRESGVACEAVVRRGQAAPQVLAYIEELNPTMVVMGTHGHTGWKHALLGSVAERVVQRAACPVLVVPSERAEKG